MKNLLLAGVAVAFLALGPARAGDIVYKPIDTNKLVVKPSRAIANVTAQTIDVVGKTAGGAIEKNGYVKTINNLFSRKVVVPHTQNGPSALPAPTMFPSTTYKSYNNPVMPIMQRR